MEGMISVSTVLCPGASTSASADAVRLPMRVRHVEISIFGPPTWMERAGVVAHLGHKVEVVVSQWSPVQMPNEEWV